MHFIHYYVYTYILQDCSVIIWTKDDSTGGSWTPKVHCGVGKDFLERHCGRDFFLKMM